MAAAGRLGVRDPARLPQGFWEAVAVWLERPQVANKRLCGSRLEARWKCSLGGGGGPEAAPAPALGAQLWAGFSRELFAFLTGSGQEEEEEQPPPEVEVVLRTVIPKATTLRCSVGDPRREMVVLDVRSGRVTFLPLEAGEGDVVVQVSGVYQLRLTQDGAQWFISVFIFCPEKWSSDGVVCPSQAWLCTELLARLARWSAAPRKSLSTGTLGLLQLEPYSRTYRCLKDKYGGLVKTWPEVTNPEKFVYEDVAIATYLLVLWEEERASRGLSAKQSFVDLGCGNGLLVHILSSEGHPGHGIDVRRRKIWDQYGPHTHLEEAAITPGDEMLFPDTDWLIGNHSDELTPWIPVIAARSSYHCRFFVLPCCFFNFDGKYQRRQSGKTQYREYLDFVHEVGAACGFCVEEDSLRIPSTKRVCLIGRTRTYPSEEEVAMDEQRTQYIHSRKGCPTPDTALDTAGRWLSGFQPREKVERVRNGATLPRELTERVVLQVAQLLLDRAQGHSTAWNPGGSLSLTEVACDLDGETRCWLRHECGGLQTLLRNFHQVFVVRCGQVRLRDWREEPLAEEAEEEGTVLGAQCQRLPTARKTRLCWFFLHHPDGCVLPAPRCPFAHGPAELRPSQHPRKHRLQQKAQVLAGTEEPGQDPSLCAFLGKCPSVAAAPDSSVSSATDSNSG